MITCNLLHSNHIIRVVVRYEMKQCIGRRLRSDDVPYTILGLDRTRSSSQMIFQGDDGSGWWIIRGYSVWQDSGNDTWEKGGCRSINPSRGGRVG